MASFPSFLSKNSSAMSFWMSDSIFARFMICVPVKVCCAGWDFHKPLQCLENVQHIADAPAAISTAFEEAQAGCKIQELWIFNCRQFYINGEQQPISAIWRELCLIADVAMGRTVPESQPYSWALWKGQWWSLCRILSAHIGKLLFRLVLRAKDKIPLSWLCLKAADDLSFAVQQTFYHRAQAS